MRAAVAPSCTLLLALFVLVPGAIRSATAASTAGDESILVFPLFVDGTANGIVYRSSLRIVPEDRADSSSLQCTLTQRGTGAAFVGLYGERYFADVFEANDRPAAVTTVKLDRLLPWEILRSSATNALATGYATLACPRAARSELLLSLYGAAGAKIGETTLEPAFAGSSFEFLVDRRDGTRLGFSLINDSSIEGEYTVIARDEFNQEVDRASDTLGPWGQSSRFVDEVVRLPQNFVGSIEILGVNGGRSYATGLQFTGPVFAVLPPIVRSSPLRF